LPAGAEERDDGSAGRAEALFEAGRAAFLAGNHAAAIRHFNAALDIRHDHAKAHYYSGLSHLNQNHYEDAADCFVMATHFKPDFPEAIYNLGLDARRRRDYGAAAACFERAVELKPDFAYAHNNLGYTLLNDLEEYERGVQHIETALRLSPQDPNIQCNYSAVFLHRGQLDEALKLCDKLLASHADLHEARLNRGLAALKLGRFAEAWPDYEARKYAQGNYIPRDFGLPEWSGQPLAGKSILVYAEQGLGDQIMFASCLPDLLQRARHCHIECAPKLETLFRRSFPTATVHASGRTSLQPGLGAGRGAIDYQVAIGSLPLHFRTDLSHFPHHAGYFQADPQRLAYWRQQLGTLGAGPKIGISWRGGAASTRRELRSMALQQWLPLVSQPSCHFVSLQYGNHGEELAMFTREHEIEIHHWQQAIDDYDDTAALVSALDLVISVQTAIVHLAGALGKSAWVMLPASPEWRYLSRGTMMPWYPSARLFRQQPLDGWQPTIAAVAAELAALLKA
jgi:tetratricopeptide (TPR) repeat protein